MIEADVRDKIAIEDFDDRAFNPFIVSDQVAGQARVADIYPELRRLRLQKSVWQLDPRLHFGTETDGTVIDRKKWTILGHKEVAEVLTNPGTYASKDLEANLGLMFGKSITAMDAPDHRKYRALFQKAFGPTMLDEWKNATVPRIVNSLIDGFKANGRAELIGEYALHFPFRFISELLSLPVEDRPIFHRLAFAQTTVRYDRAHALEAGRKLSTYIDHLIEQRRSDPPQANDFIHVLATAEVEGERLPNIVLVSFLRQLMNAAGDTSYHGFSSMMAALLMHSEQFEAVRQNRALIPDAIEEALRWEPPIVYVERSPAVTVELAGELLNPGDRLYVAIGAANRDEGGHPDPDVFNIFRPRRRHLSFGQGPHICIGQHLARAEFAVALNALLDRLPNLRLDPKSPPPRTHGVTMRKPKAINVLFD